MYVSENIKELPTHANNASPYVKNIIPGLYFPKSHKRKYIENSQYELGGIILAKCTLFECLLESPLLSAKCHCRLSK